jgi:hypothetical protein
MPIPRSRDAPGDLRLTGNADSALARRPGDMRLTGIELQQHGWGNHAVWGCGPDG